MSTGDGSHEKIEDQVNTWSSISTRELKLHHFFPIIQPARRRLNPFAQPALQVIPTAYGIERRSGIRHGNSRHDRWQSELLKAKNCRNAPDTGRDQGRYVYLLSASLAHS